MQPADSENNAEICPLQRLIVQSQFAQLNAVIAIWFGKIWKAENNWASFEWASSSTKYNVNNCHVKGKNGISFFIQLGFEGCLSPAKMSLNENEMQHYHWYRPALVGGLLPLR